MTEYIERANLIARIKYYVTHTTEGKGEHYAYSVVLNEVLNRPAADVVPVVHGRWEVVVGSDGKEHMVCTVCRKQQGLTGVFSYCPNCGAKMDGGADND